jgi:hypothetical protein
MTVALMAALAVLLAPAQIRPGVANKATPMAAIVPKLEVREFSGDFAQWGAKAALSKGGLQRDFRWTASRRPAAARYEISAYPFPAQTAYQPVAPLVASVPLTVPASGAGAFTIDFAPALQQIFGTSAPADHARFYVRVVLLGPDQKPLSPVSNTAVLEYSPPAPGTSLDQTMVLRLKSARCIRQTSGPGSDDVKITIVGAAISTQGKAKDLFFFSQDGIPDSWAIAPSHPLWTYSGLGFTPNVYIVAAVVEDDTESSGFVAVSGVKNSGHQTGQLVAQLQADTCQGGDSCLGGPQILNVNAADWNKVALGKQIVTKRLRFSGDGGVYELVFELAPK